MRILLSVIAFIIIPLLSMSAEKRPLAVEDSDLLQEISDPAISPDKRWIAFRVEHIDAKKDKSSGELYMILTGGGDPIRLTSNDKDDTKPQWSPDNRYLSFLSKRDKKKQLYLLDRNGGEAMQLTDIPQGVSDFQWSPDSKKLVLVLPDPNPDEPAEKEKDSEEKPGKPIVIKRLQFKYDEIGYLSERRDHLYSFDVATKKLTQITSGPYDDSWPRWSPDGKSILFTSNRSENPDGNRNVDLFLVPAEGGTLFQITKNPGTDEHPEWSPDGKWIVYETMRQPELMWYDMTELAVISPSGGEPRFLTAEVDRNCTYPAFGNNGATIYFRLEDRGTDRIASIPAKGGVVNRNVTGENQAVDFQVGSDGSIAMAISRFDLFSELSYYNHGKTKQMTTLNTKPLENVQLGKVERMQFQSADGTPVEAFLNYPPNFDPNKKWPMVMRIHGGPTAQFNEEFNFEWQILAANGFVVLGINPRGSTGYGEEFCKAIFAGWGIKDYEDLMAGVDAAIAKGFIDSQNLGVMGWSYGGIMTNVVITKTQRFRAAASGASDFNYFSGYGIDHYQYEWETELGLPWENEKLWRDLSPFFRAAAIKTPTLVLSGQDDWNVPLINSEELYQTLRRLGIDTMLVVYPGEPHTFFVPSHKRDRYRRYLSWFGHYLQGKPEKEPAKSK